MYDPESMRDHWGVTIRWYFENYDIVGDNVKLVREIVNPENDLKERKAFPMLRILNGS